MRKSLPLQAARNLVGERRRFPYPGLEPELTVVSNFIGVQIVSL